MKHVLIPDGYFPDGTVRPYRKARVLGQRGEGDWLVYTIEYLDDGEQNSVLARFTKPVDEQVSSRE